jgi:Ser/Thr protein kinase RdoA (MazF antagonist)
VSVVAPDPAGLAPVLAAFGAPGAVLRPLGTGLINQTLLVEGPPRGRFVLQRLHAIFPPEVNDDIDAVTRHLAARGLVTPRIIPAVDGRNWATHDGGTWRALTWVDGVGLDRLATPAQAREAGAVLARFHRAVGDFGHEFRSRRPGVHDTPRHLANLRRALEAHAGHRRYAEVAPLGREILATAAALEPLPAVAGRVVHGDPKAANILFTRDQARAICLVDLDTLARMALPLELGDAFRSWCNPGGEDRTRASFSTELFAAGVAGYADGARDWVTAAEVAAIVPATLTIYVELAARFCADALEESYFGWNPREFPGRSEHNQVRAESQLAAARSLVAQRAAAEAAVRRAFGG